MTHDSLFQFRDRAVRDEFVTSDLPDPDGGTDMPLPMPPLSWFGAARRELAHPVPSGDGLSVTQRRPLLLDLFCGAGGCSEGYRRAGFDVVGVDIKPQPRYPMRFFIEADALDVMDDLLAGGSFLFGHDGGRSLADFSAIHASPPCQAYNQLAKEGHPRLIEPVRERLTASGLPYVIENIPRAPLLCPTILCGSSFGLKVRRHRAFETNWRLLAPLCAHGSQRSNPHRLRAGYEPHPDAIVPVYGGGQAGFSIERCREAMGIGWMMTDELNEAIPPAYTEHIGTQLYDQIVTARAA